MNGASAGRRIRVDAKKFAAAWNFVSHEETRYYLNGVHIEPHVNGGVLMVATDGHTLAAIHDPEGEANGQFICPVPSRMVNAARSRSRRRSSLDVPKHIHFVGATAYLTGDHGTDDFNPDEIGPAHIEIAYAPAIDGTFPEWRRVVPRYINDIWKSDIGGYVFTINGAYIARFADAARLLGADKSPALSFYVSDHGAGGPIAVHAESVPEFFGVIIPMRGSNSPHPEWTYTAAAIKETVA